MFSFIRHNKVVRYLLSPSTQLGFLVGLIFFVAYAVEYSAWFNGYLILVGLYTAFFIPLFSIYCNKAEEYASQRSMSVTCGKMARVSCHLLMNISVFAVLNVSGIVTSEHISSLGGIWGVAGLTTLSSQGLQYIAVILANRGFGDKNRNVLIALSFSIVFTSLATLGIFWINFIFIVLGWTVGAIVVGAGLLSDCRSIFYPKGGVGVYFGDFNPFNARDVAVLKTAIKKRQLTKVFVHASITLSLHINALKRQEIEMTLDDGVRVYQTTEKADVNVNYFPTGNRFYDYDVRLNLIKAELKRSGLVAQVEVLSLPLSYEDSGFYGVLKKIKQMEDES